jgi:uncharacterized membrane protein YcaP (DUF421 family)
MNFEWDHISHLHEWFNISPKEAHTNLFFVAIETLFIAIAVMFLVEFAGRKAVAGLTMTQFIITITIGEVVLMPVIEEDFSFFKAVTVIIVLVLFLILLEWLELKFNAIENLLSHKSKIVYEEGKFNIKNLKKMRYTIDQLEMELRNEGIETYNDLKIITVEPNGKIGYQYKIGKKPITREEMVHYMDQRFKQLLEGELRPIHFNDIQNYSDDLFKEVIYKERKIIPKKKNPDHLK